MFKTAPRFIEEQTQVAFVLICTSLKGDVWGFNMCFFSRKRTVFAKQKRKRGFAMKRNSETNTGCVLLTSISNRVESKQNDSVYPLPYF